MHEGLDRWGELARETDAESYAAAMIAEMQIGARDATATRAFLQAMPPETLCGPDLNATGRTPNG